jgi:hypothetical protein
MCPAGGVLNGNSGLIAPPPFAKSETQKISETRKIEQNGFD